MPNPLDWETSEKNYVIFERTWHEGLFLVSKEELRIVLMMRIQFNLDPKPDMVDRICCPQLVIRLQTLTRCKCNWGMTGRQAGQLAMWPISEIFRKDYDILARFPDIFMFIYCDLFKKQRNFCIRFWHPECVHCLHSLLMKLQQYI